MRTLRPILPIALVFGVLAAAVAPAGQRVKPAFELPMPTGSAEVGTTAWLVADDARREALGESRGAREVEVIAYYPAQSGRAGRTAPYLRGGREEVRALFPSTDGGAGLDALDAVGTHGRVDAEPARGARLLPLVVFSHGFAGFASSHAALLEDLASHGYVVLNINHPYESGGARLADGSFASFLDRDGKPRQSFLDVVGEWSKEDETMAAVTRSGTHVEQRRLLRGYLQTLRRTDEVLRRWVADTRLVLDRLRSMPPGSVAAQLATRVDASRVGVGGHSMGGVAAGQFCVEDSRCRAGFNFDGIPQYGSMIDASLQRPFLMVYSQRVGRVGASDSIYRVAASPYYRIDVNGTLHLDFTDMNFWPTRLRERGAFGAIAPARAAAATRAIVRAFLDETLGGRPSSLGTLQGPFPELTFRRIGPP
jgi:predicted dienelactone hydrolase